MKWLFTVILFNSLPYQSECLYIIYVHCNFNEVLFLAGFDKPQKDKQERI